MILSARSMVFQHIENRRVSTENNVSIFSTLNLSAQWNQLADSLNSECKGLEGADDYFILTVDPPLAPNELMSKSVSCKISEKKSQKYMNMTHQLEFEVDHTCLTRFSKFWLKKIYLSMP